MSKIKSNIFEIFNKGHYLVCNLPCTQLVCFQAENVLFSFDWIINGNRYNKPKTSCLMKTSPEVEIALYTLCFQTRRNVDCIVSINDGELMLIENSNYNGKDNIGSAYAAC